MTMVWKASRAQARLVNTKCFNCHHPNSPQYVLSISSMQSFSGSDDFLPGSRSGDRSSEFTTLGSDEAVVSAISTVVLCLLLRTIKSFLFRLSLILCYVRNYLLLFFVFCFVYSYVCVYMYLWWWWLIEFGMDTWRYYRIRAVGFGARLDVDWHCLKVKGERGMILESIWVWIGGLH